VLYHSVLWCASDGDTDSWLMRGEYEMQLCLSAEAAGSLSRALSHVNKAVGMYNSIILWLTCAFILATGMLVVLSLHAVCILQLYCSYGPV